MKQSHEQELLTNIYFHFVLIQNETKYPFEVMVIEKKIASFLVMTETNNNVIKNET